MDSHLTVVAKADFRLSLPGQWVETTTGSAKEGYQFINSENGEYLNVTILEVKPGVDTIMLESLTAQIVNMRKSAFQKLSNDNVQFSPVQTKKGENTLIAEFAGHDITNKTLFYQHIRSSLKKIVTLNIYTSSAHFVNQEFSKRCVFISESLEINGI